MPTPARHAHFLVPALLALACLAPGAELSWSGSPGDQAPAGWTNLLGKSADAKVLPPTVRYLDRAIEISGPGNLHAVASLTPTLPEATDAQPLRVSAVIAAVGERPLENAPILLALSWSDGGVFAVALGDIPGQPSNDLRAWAQWSGGAKPGQAVSECDFGSAAVPVHVRVVVTAHAIAAYGSRDGWTWNRVVSLDRASIKATGTVQRISIGRGRIEATGLTGDPVGHNRQVTLRCSDLRAESTPASAPAALISSYVRQETYGDTIAALIKPGQPLNWRIHGPDQAPPGAQPVTLPESTAWRDLVLPADERYLQLGTLLPGAGQGLRVASTTIRTEAAGWQRVIFDGRRASWLYVAGRLTGAEPREHDQLDPERGAALVYLPAGEHQVAMVVWGDEASSSATLRWENGDPLRRIALLRRLLIDFPDDGALASAPFEIARLWEGAGFAREAAQALADLAKLPEGGRDGEQALAERARLLRQLGDDAGAAAEIDQLTKRWGSENDPAATMLRIARLWQRLETPERAEATLSEALRLTDLTPAARVDLAVERARVQYHRGDKAAAVADLRVAAGFLAPGGQPQADLLLAAARHEALAEITIPPVELERLTRLATTPARARQLAGIHSLRKDQAACVAARLAGAKFAPDSLDLLAVDAAETLALPSAGFGTAKDLATAAGLYRQTLVQLGAKPVGTTLPQLRGELLRTVLAEHRLGVRLLSEAAAIKEVKALSWKICGPFALDDWRAFETPPCDPATADVATPVAGKPWIEPPAQAIGGEGIDLVQAGIGENQVMLLLATVESASDGEVDATAGADDALAVWVNGRRIYSDHTQRALAPDSIPLRLPLRKGRNTLLCAVQNGSGGSGFAMRIGGMSTPAYDLAVALQLMGSDMAGRGFAKLALDKLVRRLRAYGRAGEEVAVLRALIRLWPDLPTDQMTAYAWTSWDLYARHNPDFVREMGQWLAAWLADRGQTDTRLMNWYNDNFQDVLLAAGAATGMVEPLQRRAAVELEASAAARNLLHQADAWFHAGYPRKSVAVAGQALDLAAGDAVATAEVEKRQRTARQVKGDMVRLPVPIELVNDLRIAERDAASGDGERAAQVWQQVIKTGREAAVATAGGGQRGAATFAAQRLREAGGAALAAWRKRHDERAAAAFALLADSSDPVAVEAIAQRWPVASCVGDVLARAAELWAARGAWQLALGSARKALAEGQPTDRAHVLVRIAEAAARLGDRAALDTALELVVKEGRPVAWNGADLAPARFAETLRAVLAKAAEPELKADKIAAALVVRLPPDGVTAGHTARGESDQRHAAATAVLLPDQLLIATGSELLATDPVSGALRWRLAADPAPTGPVPASGDAIPVAGIAAEGGVVVTRHMRGGALRLVAVEAASGRQLWSSEAVPELSACTAMTVPRMAGGRVWAWFATRDSAQVVCLGAADGSVLWSTSLGTGPVRQPMAPTYELNQAGQAPAPLLSGRDLVVSTDAGQIACLDAVTGTLQWIHTYPRLAPNFSPQGGTALQRLMGRGAGVIAADDQRVYVAPRDTLALIALNRATGVPAWSADLADVRELAGLSSGCLVVAGTGVSGLDPVTGNERWRWAPSATGPRVLGHPAVGATAAWVATESGLLRLALDNGAASDGPTWSTLGLGGDVPVALSISSSGLIACGNGTVAVLRAGAAAATTADHTRMRLPVPVATGAEPAPAGQRPTAVAALWELPLGPVSALMRPFDAQGGELYAILAGAVVRIDSGTGAVAWSTPVVGLGQPSITVAGDTVMAVSGPIATVLDRASGRVRWSMSGEPEARYHLVAPHNKPAQFRLDPGALTSFRFRESWWTVRDPRDGRLISQGRSATGVVAGANVGGGVINLVVLRNNQVWIQVYDLARGALLHEADLGCASDWVTVLKLPNGSLLISNNAGSVLWSPPERTFTRYGQGLGNLQEMWQDGDRLVVFGRRPNNQLLCSFTLDAASGKLLTQDDLGNNDLQTWNEVAQWCERFIGGMTMRFVADRKGRLGVLGRRGDGAEAFFFDVAQAGRDKPQFIVPLHDRALAVVREPDGRLHARVVDPVTGTLVTESYLPGSGSLIVPALGAGTVVYATGRGLAGAAGVTARIPTPTLDADPGRREAAAWAIRASEPPASFWRTTAPVIDGDLEDWKGAAVWETPAQLAFRSLDSVAKAEPPTGVLRTRVSYDADALRFACEIPVPVTAVERTLLAVDLGANGVCTYADRPLLLALDWSQGHPQVEVLDAPMPADPTRPLPQAAAAAGKGLTWEVTIPWSWIWARTDGLPGQESCLRAGLAVWTRDARGHAGALEWGDGLVRGLDKVGLVRLVPSTKPPAPATPH